MGQSTTDNVHTVHAFSIPPCSARAFIVAPGRTITIIDVAGAQPGDFVCLSLGHPRASLSQARTRVENNKTCLTAGDRLWTNTFPPRVMFTIVRDTFGRHDLLYTPCCRYALEKRFGVSADGCLENLVAALRPWKVAPHELPDPLNLFFDVSVGPTREMQLHRPNSAAGSLIALRADMECLVAVSTCAVPKPDTRNTGYRVELTGP